MTPISALSAHSRQRLHAVGLYALATVALSAIPYVATLVSERVAFVLLVVLGIAMAFALIQLSPQIGDMQWMLANWRSFAGRLAVYFISIGVGTTLLFGDTHPLVRVCGMFALVGGAAFEWLRIEAAPQAAAPEPVQ